MAHGSNTRMEATFGITNASSKNNIFPLSLTLGHLEYEKPLNQIETTLIHHTYIHGFNNFFTWEFCLKKQRYTKKTYNTACNSKFLKLQGNQVLEL